MATGKKGKRSTKPSQQAASQQVTPAASRQVAELVADHRPDADANMERPRLPAQAEGVPQRPYSVGGPAKRISTALRILNDPVARNSFSRIYSGQMSRRWGS